MHELRARYFRASSELHHLYQEVNFRPWFPPLKNEDRHLCPSVLQDRQIELMQLRVNRCTIYGTCTQVALCAPEGEGQSYARHRDKWVPSHGRQRRRERPPRRSSATAAPAVTHRSAHRPSILRPRTR